MSSMMAIVASWVMPVRRPSVEGSAAIVIASWVPISRAIIERKPAAAVAITWSIVVAWRACGRIRVVTAVRVDLHAKINGLYFYFCRVYRR